MESKLLTIITVCFNSEKTIKRTIASVIHQLSDNVEYIIVDGASTDHTLSIIQSFAMENIKLISERDSGIYDAMNKGVAHASGKWIYFLNSDDWLADHIIAYLEAALLSHDAVDFVYGDILAHKKFNGKHWIGRHCSRNMTELSYIRKDMVVRHQALFVKKTAFHQLDGFDVSFKIASDWDFVLRGYLKGYRFYKINKIIANFSIGGISESSHLWERHRVRKKNKTVGFFDPYLLDECICVIQKYFLKYFSPNSFKEQETQHLKPAKKLEKRSGIE